MAWAAVKDQMKHLRYCVADRGVASRSLFVAIVVGPVLNLINQGDALLGAGTINWLKVGLTYMCRIASAPMAQCPTG
jgi:hypothetical protein